MRCGAFQPEAPKAPTRINSAVRRWNRAIRKNRAEAPEAPSAASAGHGADPAGAFLTHQREFPRPLTPPFRHEMHRRYNGIGPGVMQHMSHPWKHLQCRIRYGVV